MLRYQQSLIPETDFDEAYADVKEIFANSHHEHYEPILRERGHDKHDQGECERAARKAYQDGDFTYETCKKLLESANLPTRPTRTMCNNIDDKTPQAYVTYGMFTHGGVRGLTTATKEHCNLVRYLNGFAKFHLQGEGTWSSISVTKNVSSGLHRDSHNARGSENHCVTFGQRDGGGLWLELQDPSEDVVNSNEAQWKKDKTGAWIPGKTHDTKEEFVNFDPFLKHDSLPWTGDRWGLVFHTVRKQEEGSEQVKKFLRNCGFPLFLQPKSNRSPVI